MEVQRPVSEKLNKYQVVVVEVPTENDNADNISIADELAGSIVANLRKKKLFKRVYSRSSTLKKDFDLIISVKKTGGYDADIAQAWLGIFGGHSSMEIDVDLIDGKTGKVIGSSRITSSAAVKSNIFTSSSMSQAIERIGEQVADHVAHNY